MSSSPPSRIVTSEATTKNSSGWFSTNSWIVTPLIIIIAVGLGCVALQSYRARRLERRAQIIHDEGSHRRTSVWSRFQRNRTHHHHPQQQQQQQRQQNDPELGFTPPRGSLLASLQNRDGRGSANNNNNSNNDIPSSSSLAGRNCPSSWTRWGGTTHRPHDEGLDERGEAPPPYEYKAAMMLGQGGGRRHGVGADAVELARMRVEAATAAAVVGENPPEYGAVMSGAGRGGAPAEAESTGAEAVARPSRAHPR